MHRGKTSLTGSSASVRVENEGGAAAWLLGTLVAPSVQDTDYSATGIIALSESFYQASCSWQSEGPFGQSFSIAPPIQAHRGGPPAWSPTQ